jgi:succinate dehydrogenase / fumarate reductase, cytochrome b subunit
MANNRLLHTSIGRKLIMGLTGIFLVSFLIVHCGINALIFLNDSGKTFEMAAHFMGTNLLIRTMEIGLFLGIIIHIIWALIVSLRNREARPDRYAASNANANSKWYSRSMGLLGTLILMFLIIHLKHFWIFSRISGLMTEERTLFMEMQSIFSSLPVVIIYLLAMVSLSYHLMHGFQSAFQSLGLNHKKYTPAIKAIGFWFSIIIPLIFALMPIAFYTGIIQ